MANQESSIKTSPGLLKTFYDEQDVTSQFPSPIGRALKKKRRRMAIKRGITKADQPMEEEQDG